MKRLNTTLLIFLTTLALMTIGIVMVYSSSAAIAAREAMTQQNAQGAEMLAENLSELSTHSDYYLKRQALWSGLGIVALLFAYNVDYERYRKHSLWFLLVSLVLLGLVFVPGVGILVNGSRRWIGRGFLRIQPSEFAKLALIIYMANKLSERQSELKSLMRGFVPAILMLGLFFGAIVLEPDLGASMVIGLIMLVMWAVAGMRVVHLISLGVLAIPVVIAAIIAEPYRVARLVSFMNPELDPKGVGWQLDQSLVAIGSGGITGLGLGEGPQKYLFLAEAYTDFIFAVICEELGLIGAGVIIALFVFFMIQGIRVARRVPDMYGALLATGITAMISLQAFINMGVVTGLLPTKGLTLPLVSYGGSSLMINLIGIGILMNVSKCAEENAKPSKRVVPEYA